MLNINCFVHGVIFLNMNIQHLTQLSQGGKVVGKREGVAAFEKIGDSANTGE